MDVPDARYARSGGFSIAYQVVGEGPRTLLFAPHVSDLFTIWLAPSTRPFLERLAERTRLVILNPRGTGLSDRPRDITLEARMDDVTAVLDAVGAESADLLGVATSASMCALFAATYPERCQRLVLNRPYLRGVLALEGWTERDWLERLRETRQRWGDRDYLEEWLLALEPSLSDSDEALEWNVWQQRLAVSPSAAADWVRLGMETDITDVLGSILAPTLVVHRSDDRRETVRTICQQVADCRAVEVSRQYDEVAAAAILDFLHGEALPTVPDSVLATVVFTDLVGSTERAAALGDRAWRDVLERHHAAVRAELGRHRGVEVDSAGDGFFCRFDGPARAIACARRIVESARELDLTVRAGVHTGECELVGEKVAGIAVVTGSRISSLAAPGEVLVSRTVKDLVAGAGFGFEDRGEHKLKGVPGTWRLYAVADA